MRIRYNKNPHQKEFQDDVTSKFLHLSGGYGCFDASTKLITKQGLKTPEEILEPVEYLSFDGSNPVWALGTAPFLKGKDDLYRVVHEHGEFLVTGSHRVFSSDYRYLSVRDLKKGDRFFFSETSLNPYQTILESYPLEFQLDALHSKQKALNYLDDYSTYYHQDGPRLHQAIGSGQVFSPLLTYAQALAGSVDSLSSSHMGDYGQKQGRSHRDQGDDRSYIDRLVCPWQIPDISLERYVSSRHFEHTSEHNQPLEQSALRSFLRHSNQESFAEFLSLPTSKASSKVYAIEKVKNDWFWDVHIPGTNCYFAEGALHHNSGKSHGLVMKLFDLSIKNRNLAGGLVCPTYTDFKRDMLELIDAICLESRINFTYHKTEHWFAWPWSVGKTFVATAEKALKGPNWAYAVINELTLIPFERYRETISRVRLKKAPVPQVASCGTPEGLLSGYYKFFIEEPAENSRIIYGSTRDNLHNIGSDYLASLRSAYDERQLEAYLDGKFVSIIGNRFYYAYNPEVNDDPTVVENPDYPVMISMDFNVDPMVATVWQWQMDGSVAAVHEIILRENADTNKMARALIDQGYTPDRTELYPDPAGNARSTKGQPDIQILRNHGFYNIKMRPHAPPFRKRQLNVCNLLDKRKIKINPKHCPWMKRDLLLVTQDQSTLEKEKSSRELTHSSDGMDYMIDILFQYSGTKPDSKVFSLR